MTHATLFLVLDAGRADYVREDTMPFLHGLGQRGLEARFESPPGFAQRTVFFTGRYPDTSGNFSAFVYDPDRSPFSWVEGLGPLGDLVVPRKIAWPARFAIDKVTGWLTDAHHSDPAWIPPHVLPHFRPCEDMQPVHEPGALGAPSVFDLCREHDLTYRYLAHPVSGDDDRVHDTLVREMRAGEPNDLYIAQFSDTDELGHAHGPHSSTMQEQVLPDLDAKLASIHAALEAGYDTWDMFVCGDHGMAPVRRRVDVLAHLDRADAEHGEDYVAFVNSTLVALWYLTPRGHREIEPLLGEIPGARLLDQEDRRELRIPRERSWGHRMVAAEPGVLFWPDYFHVTTSTIRGMHGYLDKREEGLGTAVLASSDGRVRSDEIGRRSLVDVFPTLCDLLEIPAPDTHEGRSLVHAGPSTARGRGDPSPSSTPGTDPQRPIREGP